MINKSVLQNIIGEAIGYASLCWNPKPTGVFDATEASKCCDETIRRIQYEQAIEFFYINGDTGATLEELRKDKPFTACLLRAIENAVRINNQPRELAEEAAEIIKTHWGIK